MKLLLGLLLSMVLSFAHAERPALEKGKLVRVAKCSLGKQSATCFYLEVDSKTYKVYVDNKGEHSIYWISPTGDILVYSRSSV